MSKQKDEFVKTNNYEYWFYNNFYGDYVIGTGSKIGSFCDIGGVTGEDCMIQSFAYIPSGVMIGERCFIGPRVTFTNVKHPPLKEGEEIQETKVGDDVVIGAGAIILPGLTIGDRAVIGAGSVVTKDIPAGETWVGNPASKLN